MGGRLQHLRDTPCRRRPGPVGHPVDTSDRRGADVGEHGRGGDQRATAEAGQTVNASAGNAPAIRARICEGLGFPGVQLDEKRNAAGEPLVSTDPGHVPVRVIRTDEDVIIANAVFRMLADTQASPARPLAGVAP